MTIQEITTRKEEQTFDCKSIQIDPKALAITIAHLPILMVVLSSLVCLIRRGR